MLPYPSASSSQSNPLQSPSHPLHHHFHHHVHHHHHLHLQDHPHQLFLHPSSHLPSTVIHFDLNSLIEQNHLSQDSCLIVLDNKVYDLTIWLQDRLSCTIAHSPLLPPSGRPSPPPSPLLRSSPTLPPPNNPFDNLLRTAKEDPVEAGDLLRTMFDHALIRPAVDAETLEDWLQEYRIGDYSAQEHSPHGLDREQPDSDPDREASSKDLSEHPTHPAAGPARNDHEQADWLPTGESPSRDSSVRFDLLDERRRMDWVAEAAFKSGCGSVTEEDARLLSAYKSTHGSAGPAVPPPSWPLDRSLPRTSAQPDSAIIPTTAAPQPTPIQVPQRQSHLARAVALVDHLKQQVLDARHGVGLASTSLSDAYTRLAEAQRIVHNLTFQASEGYRPIWHQWEDHE